MTKAKQLKQIISRAVERGWDGKGVSIIYYLNDENYLIASIKTNTYYQVIFNPDFLKAYFGKGWIEHGALEKKDLLRDCENWEYHAHQILDEVLAGRCPIKYLFENDPKTT